MSDSNELYQDRHERYDEECGVEVGNEIGFAVGVVREDRLRVRNQLHRSHLYHTVAHSLTLAKKFDAVHRTTVRNSNSSPTSRS